MSKFKGNSDRSGRKTHTDDSFWDFSSLVLPNSTHAKYMTSKAFNELVKFSRK
jgi:hypothetical protein